jgi:hypothetical protein
MRIMIEVNGGNVVAVFCDEPSGVEVVMRDFDNIQAGDPDPVDGDSSLSELRNPRFAVY